MRLTARGCPTPVAPSEVVPRSALPQSVRIGTPPHGAETDGGTDDERTLEADGQHAVDHTDEMGSPNQPGRDQEQPEGGQSGPAPRCLRVGEARAGQRHEDRRRERCCRDQALGADPHRLTAVVTVAELDPGRDAERDEHQVGQHGTDGPQQQRHQHQPGQQDQHRRELSERFRGGRARQSPTFTVRLSRISFAPDSSKSSAGASNRTADSTSPGMSRKTWTDCTCTGSPW